MANFQGKNKQTIKKLFYERLKYSSQAFPSNESLVGVIKNFQFAERAMYGRINKEHIAISLNTSEMKTLKSTKDPKKQTMVVNFVADAFENFIIEFQKASISGKLDADDPYLFDVKAYRGFIDPVKGYRDYTSKIINIFNTKFLTKERRETINDFSSFFVLFSSYLSEISESLPITFGSYITSIYSGALNTGLAIHISDLDASNDSVKEEFINSTNFQFYKVTAEKHGFSINKNAPWILTADIASPSMLRYSSRYGFDSEDSILSGYYYKAYTKDIGNLKSLFYRAYSLLISEKPKNIKVNDFGMRNVTCRAELSLQEFGESYPDRKWVDFYVDIRYVEQHKPVSLAFMKIVKREAKSIQALSGTGAAQQYINTVIRGFDNHKGSFAQKVAKQQFKKDKKITKPTY
jgi:hypothetical protein